MKKIIFLFIFIICLSGCKIKTERITCTKTYIDYKYKIDNKLIAIFNNDKITVMNIYSKIKLTDENEKDNIKFNINNELDKYKINGIKINKEEAENTVILDIDVNFKKIEENDINFLENLTNKKDTITFLKSDGYTCN